MNVLKSGIKCSSNEMIEKVITELAESPTLAASLIHPSSPFSSAELRGHFQRYELLGDSVLNLLCLDFLMSKYPQMNEGGLSTKKAKIVCGKALAQWATQVNLKQYLTISTNANNKMLEDCLEAIIGAYYIKHGLEATRPFIYEILHDLVSKTDMEQSIDDDGGKCELQHQNVATSFEPLSNTELSNNFSDRQEIPAKLPLIQFCTKHRLLPMPVYASRIVPGQTKPYEVCIYYKDQPIATGESGSSSKALTITAASALKYLKGEILGTMSASAIANSVKASTHTEGNTVNDSLSNTPIMDLSRTEHARNRGTTTSSRVGNTSDEQLAKETVSRTTKAGEVVNLVMRKRLKPHRSDN